MSGVRINTVHFSRVEHSQIIFCQLGPEDVWGCYDTAVLEPAVTDGPRHLHDPHHTTIPGEGDSIRIELWNICCEIISIVMTTITTKPKLLIVDC